MLLIKSYSEQCRQQWDSFVVASEAASLLHLIGWRDALAETFAYKPHYIMATYDEKICGVLPLFETNSRLFGHALISVPFGMYGGIIAENTVVYDALRNSAETLANAIGVDYLELRNNLNPYCLNNNPTGEEVNSSHNSNASNWMSKDLYVTFQKPILGTVTENFEAIPRKQRRMIRQGTGHGLSSRVLGLEGLESFYSVYARNVRDLGTPVFPLSFFKALMKNFKDSFILSVWKDKKMVAGVLTFIFRDTLMPYYGGAIREYFQYAVNDFMYWELMRYGCEKGYGKFDFGRSKKETGPYHFKRHWGFEPQELHYHYYLVRAKHMPNVSPANPKYKLLVNVWKRLPLPVTNWLGPKLVRGVP